jgi:hypothetical protein
MLYYCHEQAFTKTAESCGAKVALTSSMYDHVKKVIKASSCIHAHAWQDTPAKLAVLLYIYTQRIYSVMVRLLVARF